MSATIAQDLLAFPYPKGRQGKPPFDANPALFCCSFIRISFTTSSELSSGIHELCQSNFGVQHSHMDPTVSTATGENASRLFRPWDSTAPSTAKVEEKSEKVPPKF